MSQTRNQVRADGLPRAAGTAAVLGLLSAAVAGIMAMGLVGSGGLAGGGPAALLWLLVLVAAAVGQAWGAVRLLRRRGRLLLALSSLPGLLPLGAMVALRQEYRELEPTFMDVVAAVPLLTLLLVLLPSVRRWAAPARSGALTAPGA